MSDLPAPLVPADCDLQDYPFMPLHVARLRDSDMAAEVDPEACWYAVLLWAVSWHQLPTGSLPNNDAVLTKLIGLGRDVKTFRKHKAGAMRGFVLCSDGRLYHSIVAEQALAGWRGKLEQRWRTECARIKKANQRNDTDHPQPTFELWMETLPESSRLPTVPGDKQQCPQGQENAVPGTSPPCPPDSPIQETGTGTGTGTGNIAGEADASLSPSPSEDRPVAYPDLFEAAWALYPHVKGRSSKKLSLVQWKRLRPDVRAALPVAVARFATEGREPRMDGGAAAMERWLRDEKFADWLQAPTDRPLGETWTDGRWTAAISIWRQDGSWDDRLGPTPGQPGCRAPSHLLIHPASEARPA